MHRTPLSALESAAPEFGFDLGEPLSIREVAKLIGCSTWLVRRRHIPAGLPCFRLSGSRGRITFYRKQVVAWILVHQQGGIF
jgi:hypothetical protein